MWGLLGRGQLAQLDFESWTFARLRCEKGAARLETVFAQLDV